MLRKSILIAILLLVFPMVVYAQFGKNNVRHNQLDKFYESHRFDIWHNLDTNDSVQMEYLRQVVDNLESARNWMSGSKVFDYNIEKRIPIFFYKTHSDMESSNLVGGFMSEGTGAFVEGGRQRMVIKADFSKPLGRAIGVHELVHEFQFDLLNPNLIQRAVGVARLPDGYFEGCAEFLAGIYDPHTRDDIRRREQRSYAANPKSLPTWEALSGGGRLNPYTMWSMIPEFLQEKFSGGIGFCTQPLKNKIGLGEYVYDMAKGELGNPDINSEKFDQRNRYYWGTEKGFEIDRIRRPKPYEENDNFKGRSVTPYGHPYPMFSPILSPDGSSIAAFTIHKNGVALVRYRIPEEMFYISKEERAKIRAAALKDKNYLKKLSLGLVPIKNLTPQLPPVPWEYLVVQGLETWPFNGFDASWSRDGKNIAFFARINRDHALVVIDADLGKILKKIEFNSPVLDQAFSPSFSPDGRKIYFSAVRNITRDLYVVDLASGEVANLTNDERFDTAPVVSPDGTKIVYVGLDGDFQHLFMLDLSSGLKEQLTFNSFNDSSPSWSDDGSALVYVSDRADRIWNLYTLDLFNRTVSQRTEFMGQVETPIFARGSLDRVYGVVFHDDDQYRDAVYPNFEIFEIKLKSVVSSYRVVNEEKPNSFSFNPNRDLFTFQLDSNQLLNPKEPPERWGCGGGSVSLGVNTYWGMFGQSYFGCSNILETKRHIGRYASYGSYRLIDYSYQNQEKRNSWGLGAYQYQLPMYYQFYDIVHRYPKQLILTSTWMKDTGFSFSTERPLNKFNRIELFSRLRHRSFYIFGSKIADFDGSIFESSPEFFTNNDLQIYNLLKTSNGSDLGFGAAYVRDTILFSPNTWGPWHGNAFRAEVAVAPRLGREFEGYTSAGAQVRTYRRLGSSVLFAGRVDLMATTKASGDFMLLGGPDRLRGIDYGSLACNQCAYASGEMRLPFPGTYILFQSIRGLLFADGAIARFSGDRIPAQRIKSYGFGMQYREPFRGLPLQFIWRRENDKWNRTVYISLNW